MESDESSEDEDHQGPSNVNKGKCSNPDSNTERKTAMKENAEKNRKRRGKFGGKKLCFRDGKRVKQASSKKNVEISSDSNDTSSVESEEDDNHQDNPLYEEQNYHFENISDVDEGVDCLLETINFNERLLEPKTRAKTWQERSIENRENWDSIRNDIYNIILGKQIVTQSHCEHCHKTRLPDTAVFCETCNHELCWRCDFDIHSKNPFHNRIFVTKTVRESINNSMFFKEDWSRSLFEVCVPLRLPKTCKNCQCDSIHLRLAPSLKEVVVVNQKGRFDLKATNFFCRKCSVASEAVLSDYVSSGFWPGNCISLTCFFSNDVLLDWYHDQHLSIGKSQNKYVKRLGEVSKEYGRCCVVNPALFHHAYKEWEFFRHQVKVHILKRNQMYCPSCGSSPIMGSSDGNMKCKRRICAGSVRNEKNAIESSERPPYYGSQAIRADESVKKYREYIYTKMPRSKQKEMCGGATFEAAKSDSGGKKGYDETGLIVSSCRHGIILGAINMHHGETFTHTHYMHHLCWELNCKYFCYDVICRYWQFAERTGEKFPEFSNMTKNMNGFAPMMHIKAHGLSCQILWNPHWKKGVGLTIGEEHEQVFSRLSLYGYKTQLMTKSNRIDHFSAGIFYMDAQKIELMPKILRNRLIRARKLIPHQFTTLSRLLQEYNIQIRDLPEIYESLIISANASVEGKLDENTPIEKLQRALEGVYVEIRNVEIFITTLAEHAKSRTRFRRKLRQRKAKSRRLIQAINQQTGKQIISESEFDEGRFPWHKIITNNDTTKFNISANVKYQLVDVWMRWQRAKEEVPITKKEMKNYLSCLNLKKKELEKEIEDPISGEKDSQLGRRVLVKSEISRLSLKIEEALAEWKLYSKTEFKNFFLDTETEETAVSDLLKNEDDVESEISDSDYDKDSIICSDSSDESVSDSSFSNDADDRY